MNESDEALVIEAVDDCRTRVARGEALETCLADYPEHLHEEIRALVEVGERVSQVVDGPSEAFAASLETSLLAEVDRRRAARGSATRRWWRRLRLRMASLAAALLTVVMLGSGFVVVEASADAVPGDPLYRVVEWREALELWLARSDAARLAQYEERVDRRIDELVRVLRRAGDEGRMLEVERRLARSTEQVVSRALAAAERGDPRYVVEVRVTLEQAQQQIGRLIASPRSQPHRPILVRAWLHLEQQLQRLDEAAPGSLPRSTAPTT